MSLPVNVIGEIILRKSKMNANSCNIPRFLFSFSYLHVYSKDIFCHLLFLKFCTLISSSMYQACIKLFFCIGYIRLNISWFIVLLLNFTVPFLKFKLCVLKHCCSSFFYGFEVFLSLTSCHNIVNVSHGLSRTSSIFSASSGSVSLLTSKSALIVA